jgi:hypothetical protein
VSEFPISDEAVEAAAKAMWGGDDWELAGRCYPWNPDMDDCLQAVLNVEVGIRAFLAAERAWIQTERDTGIRYIAFGTRGIGAQP